MLFKCQPCYKILHLWRPRCAKSLRSDLTRADSTRPQRGLTLNQGVSRIQCRCANDLAAVAAKKKWILPILLSLRTYTPFFSECFFYLHELLSVTMNKIEQKIVNGHMYSGLSSTSPHSFSHSAWSHTTSSPPHPQYLSLKFTVTFCWLLLVGFVR